MTKTLFAPPELFSAYAFAEDESESDICQGTHLRIFAGLGASFPLAPFAVFKLRSEDSELRGLHVTDREGRHQPGGLNLSQIGVGKATMILSDTDERRTVRIELEPDAPGGIRGAMLLDQYNRVIAERNEPPWLFSAPVLHALRVWGPAEQVSIHTKSVGINALIGEQQLELAGILGLPVQGRHPWYVGTQDKDDGLKRVRNGAPQRLNPMDRPDGPFDRVSPEDEIARVESMLESTRKGLGGGLENLLVNIVDDETSPPWAQIERVEMFPNDGGTKQFAQAPRLSTLQLAGIDPGLARFLGFADYIGDLPELDGRGWDTLAIVGLFAISPKDFDRRGPDFGSLFNAPLPGEDRLIETLIKAIEKDSRDVRNEIEELIAQVRKRGFVVHACVTLVSPVPPWLPPSLPEPEIFQHHWEPSQNGAPSSLYRASFAFLHAPLASMCAMARQAGGEWIPRHETVKVDNFKPPERATPRIFGQEHESFSRVRSLGLASGTSERAELLADQHVPADLGSILYRVQASDFFGRFGDGVEFEVAPPKRPPPPPPILRYHFERANIDPASTAVLSPGTLKMTVAVPHPFPAKRFTDEEQKRLSSAIVVPRIDDLAAGSLPLTMLTIRLADESRSVDLTTPGFTEVEFSLPGLSPQETKEWTLSAVFRNTDGQETEPAEHNEPTEPHGLQRSDRLTVKVTDVRAPKTYPTGMGLFWTSTPGPSKEVELKLSWPAPKGSEHRVYLTDQQGLGLEPSDIAEAVPGAEPSRGRIAMVGGKKVLDKKPIDRKGFRLLTDPPIKAGPDGRVVLETTLPRSLMTVQFLRVVPLGPDGAEPPFDTCGIVPVAVPDSRRPLPPRLNGEVDPVTGIATLDIIADGFNRIELERDEPGLFTSGLKGNEPPQFRIRRAVGAVADPIYARTIANGQLVRQDTPSPGAVFSGTVMDDNSGRGLEPFVYYIYWADVRLPPERRLPANVDPIDPPEGITPVDPANAKDHPRPMSLPSAPRVIMRVPPDPPAAPLPEEVIATRTPPDASGNVTVTIQIVAPPRAHAKAIGPYRLAIWTQWIEQSIEAASNADEGALQKTYPDISKGQVTVVVKMPTTIDPSSTLILWLAFVDPMGKISTFIRKEIQ
ncbi:MAG TPA: hypothetical protein PLY52_03530 [Methanothrix sp.]|jgi:hypothetical protein|uniref:hypothetical protein n=1 Tax=Methanothrix sp. TaxID=90426 RepID=UPI002C04BE48|nr:hypothetical protein [Methanothrix sp.]HON35366.1 hypothetical protein [Methanothrix sp.]HRU74953.1 hypothetical protein [Methanothrix sp.]